MFSFIKSYLIGEKKPVEKSPSFVLGDQILTGFYLIPTNIFHRFLLMPIKYPKLF